jgi:hypothetical protein
VGVEINAVLARRAEDKKGIDLVQSDSPEGDRGG